MLGRLIALYTSYKQGSFLEQSLRVSNTMLIVFAYWNLVRSWTTENIEGASPSILSMPGVIIIAVSAGLSGIVFGILLLIHFRLPTHLFILPIAVFASAVTLESQFLSRLIIVPIFAFLSLLLVRLIIALANRMNRL